MRFRSLLLALTLPGLAAAQPAPLEAVKVFKTTDLATKPMIGAIGDTVPLRATLTSKADGKPLAGRRVAFRVAGKDAGDALTGPAGDVKVDFKVPSDPPPGSYPMEARFTGDADHGPSSAATTFGVVKAATHMIWMSDPKAVNEGDTVQLGGRFNRTTDEDGVDGRTIALTLNGQPLAKAVSDHGNFSWKWVVPKGAPAKATVRFQFDGDALYAATGAAVEFSVRAPARPAILSFQGESGKVGQPVTFRARLFEPPPIPGIGVPGIAVDFWVAEDGNDPGAFSFPMCTATTNTNGDASCTAHLPKLARNYRLGAHAKVDATIWKVEEIGAQPITVSRSPVHVAVTGPSTAKIGQTMTIKARLTRTTDGSPLQNERLLLPELYGAQPTNANGEATFTFPAPGPNAGPHDFSVSFESNPNYEAGYGGAKVTLTK
jgi:hypothetical protein